MQSSQDKELTMQKIAVQGYKQEGLSFFFRGLGLCCTRTFFVNLVTLPLFDWVQDKLNINPNKFA